MAGTNDFQPFAIGSGANVLTQEQYLALSSLSVGFQSGVAQSAAVNKALRQATVMASVIGQFIVNQAGLDAPDDGEIATPLANFITAIEAVAPTAGRLLNVQTFNSSATFTRTAGATKGRIRMWGGGGGGSGGSSSALGAGGGGAGYVEAWIDLPETASATVGAGGAAGAIGGAGGSGGMSTFSSLSAGGGGGASAGADPGKSGSATGGYLNVAGTPGRGSFSLTAGAGQGGASFGSSGGNPHFAAGDGGISPGGGGAGGGSAAGTSGTTSAGGAGGSGLIIVEEYA